MTIDVLAAGRSTATALKSRKDRARRGQNAALPGDRFHSTDSRTFLSAPVFPDAGLGCLTKVTTATEPTASATGDTLTSTYATDVSRGAVKSLSMECNKPGGCPSMNTVTREWQPQASKEVLSDLYQKDFLGNYTTVDAGRVCWGSAGPMSASNCVFPGSNTANGATATEVRSQSFGATSPTGANALKSEQYTWQYADNTHEQLPATKSEPSVLLSGGTVVTTFRYNTYTRHLDAVIKEGWTRHIGSSPQDPGSAATKVYLATFYFTYEKCSAQAADPYGRDVEIHGPCYISDNTKTDCDGPGPMPVRHLAYNPPNSAPAGSSTNAYGRVRMSNVAVSATSAYCGQNAGWLTTWYDDYDSLGHVTRERDPNGVLTVRNYINEFLVSETVGGATTSYGYDPNQANKLTLKTFPNGLSEQYCYRAGADSSCSGGVLTDNIQWAKHWVSSTVYETTAYTYAPLAGALGGTSNKVQVTDRYSSQLAGERSKTWNGYDALGRSVETSAVDPTNSNNVIFREQSVYDENGNLLGNGAAYMPPRTSGIQPASLCGGRTSVSPFCTARTYDRLNRPAMVTLPSGTQVTLSYLSPVNGATSPGPTAIVQVNGGTGALANYEYDDFGRVLAVQTQGSPVVLMDYDGQGNVITKSEPARVERDAGVFGPSRRLSYTYDGLGRLLSVGPALGQPWVKYGYDSFGAAASNCPASGTSNLNGRLQWRDDSLGRTWYAYDGLGNVLAERRVRDGQGGTLPCASPGTLSDAFPETLYNRTPDGRLSSMRYPHGRWVFFTYGSGGANGLSERPTLVETGLLPDGGDKVAVVRDVVYGLAGQLASYTLGTDAGTGSTVSVNWYRGGSFASSGTTCPLGGSAPSSSDGTNRLWGLWVTRAEGGGVQRPLFKRQYGWQRDQLGSETTCVLDSPSATKRDYTYDSDLQMSTANPSGFFSGTEKYAYQMGSDRSESSEGTNIYWQYGYDAYRRLGSVTPRAGSCDAGYCGSVPVSWARTDLRYAQFDNTSPAPLQNWATHSGTSNYLQELRETALPPAGATPQQGRVLQFQTDDRLWGVYSAINVNGGLYRYVYDADGRRRLKAWPLLYADGGVETDEYFYADGQLLEDRGVRTLAPASLAPQFTGEWRSPDGVWTASMQGAVLNGRYDNSGFRHTFFGLYDVAQQLVRVTVARYNLATGCTNNMYGTLKYGATPTPHIDFNVTSTDGLCDLAAGFTASNTSTLVRSSPEAALVLHEYIWLGGHPVAVVRTALDSAYNHIQTAHCWRNDEYEACGTVYPVSDYLPKVVAIVDSAGRLSGAADYDAFGRVNEVPIRADVPAQPAVAAPIGYPGGASYPFGPYTATTGPSKLIGISTSTPVSGSMRAVMKANYYQVNTPGFQDRSWVQVGGASGAIAAPASQFGGSGYWGQMGAVSTNWFDVPLNWDVRVNWAAGNSPGQRYTGVTTRGLEFRRYETGAQPTWLPLSFPGQYLDSETALLENRNRFYATAVGRYTSEDPQLPSRDGLGWLRVAYAGNNPLGRADVDGLQDYGVDKRAAVVSQAINECNATGDADSQACAVKVAAKVEAEIAAIAVAAGVTWVTAAYIYSAAAASPAIAATAGGAVTAETSRGGQDLARLGPELTRHAMLRMGERGVTVDMVRMGLANGTKYWDPASRTITTVLQGGFASGKDLLIGQNLLTGRVTTVIAGWDLAAPRFVLLP